HIFFCWTRRPPRSRLFPYTTLFRSRRARIHRLESVAIAAADEEELGAVALDAREKISAALGEARDEQRERRLGHQQLVKGITRRDRKSTRLNSSHVAISYAVFCLKK